MTHCGMFHGLNKERQARQGGGEKRLLHPRRCSWRHLLMDNYFALSSTGAGKAVIRGEA